MCTLKKMARKLQIFFSSFLNFKYHFFLCVIALKCVWKRVLVYQLVANNEEMKKVVFVPQFWWKCSLISFSKTSVLPPTHTVVCVLGILLVPWGTIFGMLQLPCGIISLPLNQENGGLVGVLGENKSWKHLYFFHWKFSIEEGISKLLQFIVLYCTRGFKISDLLDLVNIGQVIARDENST